MGKRSRNEVQLHMDYLALRTRSLIPASARIRRIGGDMCLLGPQTSGVTGLRVFVRCQSDVVMGRRKDSYWVRYWLYSKLSSGKIKVPAGRQDAHI